MINERKQPSPPRQTAWTTPNPPGQEGPPKTDPGRFKLGVKFIQGFGRWQITMTPIRGEQ